VFDPSKCWLTSQHEKSIGLGGTYYSFCADRTAGAIAEARAAAIKMRLFIRSSLGSSVHIRGFGASDEKVYMPILDFLMSDDQLKKYWPAAPAIPHRSWRGERQAGNSRTAVDSDCRPDAEAHRPVSRLVLPEAFDHGGLSTLESYKRVVKPIVPGELVVIRSS